MDNPDNKYLYIAIILPILMIAITAISAVYYKVELHPQHNFVYMIKNDTDAYQCWRQLKTEIFPKDTSSQMVTSIPPADCSTAKFYEYDFASKESTPVTLQQVQQMKLSDPEKQISSDGFKINNYCYSSDVSGWWFSNQVYYSVCLKKDDLEQKLNIDSRNYYFIFVGWILDSVPRYST